ncbi:hypothetical protein N478_11175 [Pseudoalteromonas luteoviolacea S4060-1]|uniref:Lipoprotein n=2 Tax=Pseudoalteromonas luteoviolacea TaxID=43657 RepID=A0A167NZA5_9GAMM|nr:hypothetical protein N478_11175 [Pseudoalteromonas luteoviolacea S4060-1]
MKQSGNHLMQRSLIGLYLGVGFVAGLQVFHLWSGCHSTNSKQISGSQYTEQNGITSVTAQAHIHSDDTSTKPELHEYIQTEIAKQLTVQTEELKQLINQLKEQQPIITTEAYGQDDETLIMQSEVYTNSLSTLDASIAVGYFDDTTASEVMSKFNDLSDDQKLKLITRYSEAINSGKIHFEKPLIEFIN